VHLPPRQPAELRGANASEPEHQQHLTEELVRRPQERAELFGHEDALPALSVQLLDLAERTLEEQVHLHAPIPASLDSDDVLVDRGGGIVLLDQISLPSLQIERYQVACQLLAVERDPRFQSLLVELESPWGAVQLHEGQELVAQFPDGKRGGGLQALVAF